MREQNLGGKWQFRQAGATKWLPASVPGGVHTDLLALGHIPDPFFADNELRVQWVAESDWDYRKLFAVDSKKRPGEKTFLVCDGLDTLAEVSLNGKPLGKADNQFRTWRFDVTGLPVDGENELTVLFRSPLAYIHERQLKRPLTGGGDIPGGPYLRKSPYHWGWDWGPKLPAIGIWQDIRLETYATARLADVLIRQQHQNGKVRISASAQVEAWSDEPLQMQAVLVSPEGIRTEAAALVDANSAAIELAVANPQLWWPREMGAQALYRLEILLLSGAATLDRRIYDLGLRTIALRREPDEWGELFPVRGQRRAAVRQGRGLDPGRLVHHPRDGCAHAVAASIRSRRAHEHAAGVGRRDLRRGSLL